MVDLATILQAVIGVIAVVITVYLIPQLKRKLTAEEQTELAEWVSKAVAAAKQRYDSSGCGELKKAYITSFLESKGYTTDTESMTDTVDSLVEAAAYEPKSS